MLDGFDFTQLASNHWPFLVVSLILGLVGEVMKRIMFPRGMKGLTGWRWWAMITLPLHAPAVGFLAGFLPFMPCPEGVCSSGVHRCLYYAAAGMFSSYGYAGAKHILKEKLGVPADPTTQA